MNNIDACQSDSFFSITTLLTSIIDEIKILKTRKGILNRNFNFSCRIFTKELQESFVLLLNLITLILIFF